MIEKLFDAIKEDDLKTCKELLAAIKDKKTFIYWCSTDGLTDGMTALSFAAHTGNLAIFQELFEHFMQGDSSASKELFLKECTCALREAAAAGHLEVIKFLLNNEKNPISISRIIQKPVKGSRYYSEGQILVPSSSDSKSVRRPGHTAISLAVQHNRLEVLRYLLPLVVLLPSDGDYGYNAGNLGAADIAIATRNLEALKLLYSYGCELSLHGAKLLGDMSKLKSEDREKALAVKTFHEAAQTFYLFMQHTNPNKTERLKFNKEQEIENLMALLGDALLARCNLSHHHRQSDHYCFNYTAVNFAILHNYDTLIEKLLKTPPAFIFINNYEDTLLSDAVRVGNMKLVKHFAPLVLKHPLKEKILSHALRTAIKEGYLEVVIFIVNKLFKPGDNIIEKFVNRMSLERTILKNKVEVLYFLLSRHYIHENLVNPAACIMDTITIQNIWLGQVRFPHPAYGNSKTSIMSGCIPINSK